MANKSTKASYGSKRKAAAQPKGNDVSKRIRIGKLDPADEARTRSLATLGKVTLLPYYCYLHAEQLVDKHAPSPDEISTAWNAQLVASICAISESRSPSLADLKKGVFVPSPPEP